MKVTGYRVSKLLCSQRPPKYGVGSAVPDYIRNQWNIVGIVVANLFPNVISHVGRVQTGRSNVKTNVKTGQLSPQS